MAAAPVSSEKVDLLIYGPLRPILETGFPDNFNVHKAETRADLERLPADVLGRIRGVAVTYHTVKTDAEVMALRPRLEIVASFGVGYDHVAAAHAGTHNLLSTSPPAVLPEEVADVALGLLIASRREIITADQHVRSGEWTKESDPLS